MIGDFLWQRNLRETYRIVPEPLDPQFKTSGQYILNPYQETFLARLFKESPKQYRDYYSDQSDIRFEVFSHLTKSGFYVTFGLNFGADFLAYE